MMDNVNLIIYPIQYSKQAYGEQWKGQTAISSTKGRVVDHVGFSVDSLNETIERLKSEGVKISNPTSGPRGLKRAFIEGPDYIQIELVEGHAHSGAK